MKTHVLSLVHLLPSGISPAWWLPGPSPEPAAAKEEEDQDLQVLPGASLA